MPLPYEYTPVGSSGEMPLRRYADPSQPTAQTLSPPPTLMDLNSCSAATWTQQVPYQHVPKKFIIVFSTHQAFGATCVGHLANTQNFQHFDDSIYYLHRDRYPM